MPRPKSFNPDEALAKAMRVFWERGYDAASIAELTDAMGINRFSLYDTFGDKHALYLKALESYERSFVDPMVERIDAIGSMDDLESFFFSLAERKCDQSDQTCCMIQKAAISLAPKDDSTADLVSRSRERVHGAFVTVFHRLIENDEIRPGITPEQGAWLIMLTHAGLTSHAGTPLPQDQIKGALAALFGSIRAAAPAS